MVADKFNTKAMENIVKEDLYLTHVFVDLMNKGHEKDDLLRILFNENVLGDSGYTQAYLEELKRV